MNAQQILWWSPKNVFALFPYRGSVSFFICFVTHRTNVTMEGGWKWGCKRIVFSAILSLSREQQNNAFFSYNFRSNFQHLTNLPASSCLILPDKWWWQYNCTKGNLAKLDLFGVWCLVFDVCVGGYPLRWRRRWREKSVNEQRFQIEAKMAKFTIPDSDMWTYFKGRI